MSRLTLYHGSKKIISLPALEEDESFKDFGPGFYLTEDREAALEWACSPGSSGFANKFEIETENLNILDLYSEKYTILHWLSFVMSNRKFMIADSSASRALEYLYENFPVERRGYDIIKGMRADETYFLFVKAFLKGKISLGQLKSLMDIGPMGEQIVIMSPDSLRRLMFISFEGADAAFVYPKKKVRNDAAFSAYRALAESGDEKGIFISDIIREEIKSDDERLR